MYKLLAALVAAFFLCSVQQSDARVLDPYPIEQFRPQDCYGIPWCGCYARHVIAAHDPGKEYNAARNWGHWGHRANSLCVGCVVAWRHHVGQIVGPCSGKVCPILSGNDGHRVRIRWRSVAGANVRVGEIKNDLLLSSTELAAKESNYDIAIGHSDRPRSQPAVHHARRIHNGVLRMGVRTNHEVKHEPRQHDTVDHHPFGDGSGQWGRAELEVAL